MKYRCFSRVFGLAALLALAACGGGTPDGETVPELQSEPTWEDPEAPQGITVSQGRFTLPAVTGNPGAVYFSIENTGQEDVVIRSAWLSGADAVELHETIEQEGTARMVAREEVPVPAGRSVEFAPGGLHLMVFGLSGSLEPGAETEVTLTFANGDKVSFPATIRRAGDAGATLP